MCATMPPKSHGLRPLGDASSARVVGARSNQPRTELKASGSLREPCRQSHNQDHMSRGHVTRKLPALVAPANCGRTWARPGVGEVDRPGPRSKPDQSGGSLAGEDDLRTWRYNLRCSAATTSHVAVCERRNRPSPSFVARSGSLRIRRIARAISPDTGATFKQSTPSTSSLNRGVVLHTSGTP